VTWVISAAAFVLPLPAAATTADDLCGPAVDPCRITDNESVTPGSIIDFGTRRLIIANRGALELESGTMTIRAAQFTIENGGRLEGRGSGQDPGGRINVVANAITIAGTVDATGTPGGTVILTSMGPLTLNAPIEARSRSGDSGGGSVQLQGNTVTINAAGRITAFGGAEDFGGDVSIIASGPLTLSSQVDASGGDGGSIDVDATGALTIGADAVLDVRGTVGGGSGGDITVRAAGALVMNGEMTAAGRNGTVDTGAGDGGTIGLEAASITIANVDARIEAPAGSPDGVGGDVELISDIGIIDVRGDIEVRGAGADSSGGLVSIDATGAASVTGEIDASGGRGGGGDIEVLSESDVDLPATASLTVAASSSGDGGDIDVSSGGAVTIRGVLASDGGPTEGATAGSIFIQGCSVNLVPGGRLSNLRSNGLNTVIGRDSTAIGGTMRADTSTGRNSLRYAGPEYQPAVLPGAQVDPPASLIEDDTIVPCNPVNTFTPGNSPTATRTRTGAATPSPTVTPTRVVTTGASRTATPTATPTPNPCTGDCDGSSTVSISDLITCVNISLGSLPLANCPACDPDGSGTVSISELIQAVGNSLNGCPS
jgi:hypothetical protein